MEGCELREASLCIKKWVPDSEFKELKVRRHDSYVEGTLSLAIQWADSWT